MQVLKKKSILDRLDPRLKITVTLLFTVVPFAVTNWLLLGLMLFIIIALIQLTNLSVIYCLQKLKSPAIMVLIMIFLQFLMMPHIDAFWHGLLVFGRLVIVMMSWFILLSTMTQMAFILCVESVLHPIQKLGFKTGSIMLTFRIIQRFVPSLMQEAHKILKAQASRGLDIKGANIWQKMRLMTALLLPVFVMAIKKADEQANTMAIRGYVLNQERTTYQTLKRLDRR